MTRRLLLFGLLLLAGVLIPSAAGGFLALAAVTPTQTVFRPTDDTYSSAYLDVLHAHQDGGGG